MKNKISIIVSTVMLSVLCFSCQHKEAYYYYHQIKHAEWSKLDTLYYNIDSTLIDPNIKYNISIELTSNANYPYQNIWFFIQDNMDCDTIFKAASNQYLIADEMGKWHGSGFGSLYQLSLVYKTDIRFNERRNYILKIVHGMRDEPLYGVEKVGVKVEEAR